MDNVIVLVKCVRAKKMSENLFDILLKKQIALIGDKE